MTALALSPRIHGTQVCREQDRTEHSRLPGVIYFCLAGPTS